MAQGRADWGVAISPVAHLYDLGFLPLVVEHYDLVVPRARRDRAPVQRLIDLLTSEDGRELLRGLGFEPAVPPAADISRARSARCGNSFVGLDARKATTLSFGVARACVISLSILRSPRMACALVSRRTAVGPPPALA